MVYMWWRFAQNTLSETTSIPTPFLCKSPPGGGGSGSLESSLLSYDIISALTFFLLLGFFFFLVFTLLPRADTKEKERKGRSSSHNTHWFRPLPHLEEPGVLWVCHRRARKKYVFKRLIYCQRLFCASIAIFEKTRLGVTKRQRKKNHMEGLSNQLVSKHLSLICKNWEQCSSKDIKTTTSHRDGISLCLNTRTTKERCGNEINCRNSLQL